MKRAGGARVRIVEPAPLFTVTAVQHVELRFPEAVTHSHGYGSLSNYKVDFVRNLNVDDAQALASSLTEAILDVARGGKS